MAKTKAGKRGVELRIIERKNFKAKRGTRSDYAAFEEFRRDLYNCGEEAANVAFASGRVLRRQWAKAGNRLRVTFGSGKRALDSFIRITSNGKRIFEQTV